ncbi:glycosyltransferase [Anatilimnocola sp. NA78]|uniref:glycosyltransferase n=1 Tax=Anatilimnocola sp. NA78 TaxID=3415683 RepID=UPI003CE5A520
MTIRILQIIPTLVHGGAEKQLSLLATGLPRDRFDVHVCVLTHTGPLEEQLREAEIPLSLINKRWKIDPFAYWRLRTEIKRLQPDIVQTWLFAANAYGRQAAMSTDVKHILASERCVDPWKGRVQLSIDRVLAKRTERIITNSTGVQEFYAERGIPGEKFVVIPNGIRPFARAETTSREALLQELKLPAGTKLIGAIGRLWPQKRVKDLIWATDLLQCIRDDTHLLIIGDGPQRWRLERYAEQANVTSKVHFLGERNDVPRILPHLDLLWLASGYEGQSNAVLEGMSAGLPIVASDIPGNRDLVVHDQTGFLVDVGDRGSFAQRAQQLLDDPELAQRLGAAGRQRVLDEFSVEKMVARHASLYEQIAG